MEYAGALYHLTARGNARADIFVDDDDRRRFLELLGQEITQQGWRCYAYCLMNNHYHLLIETPEPNLVAGMRRLNGVYTQTFNRRHKRVGHVFQGRYKSIIVDKDSYGLELCRYIVLNPVRARMVRLAQHWAWSSYRATVSQVAAPAWLDADWVLGQFSGRYPKVAYEHFVAQGLGQASPWDSLKGQIWLGGAAFLNGMESFAKAVPMANVPYRQRHPTHPTATAVTAQVLSAYRIKDEKTLCTREHQEAFKAWVYLLRRAANLPLQEVSNRSKVSPSRISKIQRALETSKPSKALRELFGRCKVKN
ncbi:MAG: transposase [Burkholderiales bacterium]|nr:transposase [Burkholderiales bacterium]